MPIGAAASTSNRAVSLLWLVHGSPSQHRTSGRPIRAAPFYPEQVPAEDLARARRGPWTRQIVNVTVRRPACSSK